MQIGLVHKKMENLEQMEKALQNTTQILEETNQIDWTGILNLIHLTDMEKMLVEQYKNGENLNIRISLHEQYSQNKQGWFPWLLEQMDFDGARRILEIGCGNGQLWENAEPSVLKGKYICLSDLSDGMIRDCLLYTSADPMKTTDLLCGVLRINAFLSPVRLLDP